MLTLRYVDVETLQGPAVGDVDHEALLGAFIRNVAVPGVLVAAQVQYALLGEALREACVRIARGLEA